MSFAGGRVSLCSSAWPQTRFLHLIFQVPGKWCACLHPTLMFCSHLATFTVLVFLLCCLCSDHGFWICWSWPCIGLCKRGWGRGKSGNRKRFLNTSQPKTNSKSNIEHTQRSTWQCSPYCLGSDHTACYLHMVTCLKIRKCYWKHLGSDAINYSVRAYFKIYACMSVLCECMCTCVSVHMCEYVWVHVYLCECVCVCATHYRISGGQRLLSETGFQQSHSSPWAQRQAPLSDEPRQWCLFRYTQNFLFW